jgi:hypothetical protein
MFLCSFALSLRKKPYTKIREVIQAEVAEIT